MKEVGVSTKTTIEGVSAYCSRWIRNGRPRSDLREGVVNASRSSSTHGRSIAGVRDRFDILVHHSTNREHGKEEGLHANSLKAFFAIRESSEKMDDAKWRAVELLQGSAAVSAA